MNLLFAALALGAPVHVAIAAPLPIERTAAASANERLAQLLLPERAMVDLVVKAARSEARRNPAFAKDPALGEFVFARLRPDIETVVRAGLPEFRADIARIIAAELSAGEIDDLYTFFSSPTGQRLQQASFDVIGENPAADPASQQQLAVDRFMATLTPADYPVLAAFGTSAGAQKMPHVTPKISAASAAWADRLLTRHNDRFDAARSAAIADYQRQKAAK